MEFYIGKAYSFRDFNCWDYVSLIREENNIKTKQYQPLNLSNAFDLITAEMQKLGNGLTLINSPQDFSIVIGSRKNNNKFLYHCGLYYQGMVMHCDRNLRQVVSEPYNEFTSKFQDFKIWL